MQDRGSGGEEVGCPRFRGLPRQRCSLTQHINTALNKSGAHSGATTYSLLIFRLVCEDCG